jgi:light-harvesting complex 1 beta chain
MAHEIAGVGTTGREGSLEGFQSIYVVIFCSFVILALVSLLCTQNWRTFLPGAEGARSIFDGVKSAVYTVLSQLT